MPRARFFVAGFVVVAALAVSLVAGELLAQQHTVTKVVAAAKPNTFSGPCPTEIQFIGTIFVSRHPVTVEYRWERSDGAMGERQKVEIGSAGQGVYESWKLGARGKHYQVWEKLHVLAPTGISSAPATAKVTCQ
jgi:hypothetical protein